MVKSGMSPADMRVAREGGMQSHRSARPLALQHVAKGAEQRDIWVKLKKAFLDVQRSTKRHKAGILASRGISQW